jgi:1-acyl-sn-glycerol-3-phosphate acyltransferase
MAKEELFRSRLTRFLLPRLGAFPVRRGRPDKGALTHAMRCLQQGKPLVVFPEGSRKGQETYTPDGHLGAALLAGRAGVPVVPVGIYGTEVIHGWKWMLRRPRITVTFGTPFLLPDSDGGPRRHMLAEHTELIMRRIAALLPEPAEKGPDLRAGGQRQ